MSLWPKPQSRRSMTWSYRASGASLKACPPTRARSCWRSTSHRVAVSRRNTPGCKRSRTGTTIEASLWPAFRVTSSFTRSRGQPSRFRSFAPSTTESPFPLFSKLDVKGPSQHPLYAILSGAADDSGKAGNVSWNFEKFLVGRDGLVVRRFRSKVVPEDPRILEAIESIL